MARLPYFYHHNLPYQGVHDIKEWRGERIHRKIGADERLESASYLQYVGRVRAKSYPGSPMNPHDASLTQSSTLISASAMRKESLPSRSRNRFSGKKRLWTCQRATRPTLLNHLAYERGKHINVQNAPVTLRFYRF